MSSEGRGGRCRSEGSERAVLVLFRRLRLLRVLRGPSAVGPEDKTAVPSLATGFRRPNGHIGISAGTPKAGVAKGMQRASVRSAAVGDIEVYLDSLHLLSAGRVIV